LKSEEDVHKIEEGNYAGVEILTPHRHVIGENHSKSMFKKAVDDWSWGAARMSEKLTSHPRMASSPQEREVRENKDEPEYQAMPLENTVAKQLYEINYASYLVEQIMGIQNGDTKKGDEEKKYDKEAYEKAFKRCAEKLRDNLPGLMQINKAIKTYKKNSPGYFSKKFRNATDYSGLPEITAFLNIKKKSELFWRVYRSIGIEPRIDDVSPKAIEKLMVVLTAMKDACLAIIKGDDKVGYDVYVNHINRREDRDDAMEKALTLRDRYMVQNISTLTKPGMVKVGRDHLPGLTGIPDVRLHEDYTVFKVATQADEVLR
jgi:hypothetical protein